MGQGTRMAVSVCLFAAVLAACTGKKTTVSTPGGNVTVEQGPNGQSTTTIKSGQGEVKFGKGAVDPASIGLPLYPGATQSDEGSMSLSHSANGEGGQVLVMTTGDDFDKVYDFYRSQMPAGSEKLKMSSGGSQMASFQVGDTGAKDSKSVVIRASNGKVTIELLRSTKD
jgi:hypothetical protein